MAFGKEDSPIHKILHRFMSSVLIKTLLRMSILMIQIDNAGFQYNSMITHLIMFLPCLPTHNLIKDKLQTHKIHLVLQYLELITAQTLIFMIFRRLKYLTSHLVSHQTTVQKILLTTQLMNKTSSVTLGPNGRLVAIQSEVHQPRITKDGVTVIKSLEFEDRLMNAVATLVKKAADNANKYSGDGTTTTTLLTFQLVRIANKYSGFGINQKQFRQGLQKGKNLVLQFLDELSVKVESQQKLKQVAMIATNNDESLSNLVSEAIFKSQSVNIEKSKQLTSSLEFTTGMKITRGIPQQMLVNKINKIEFNYPIILVHSGKINQVKEILPAIQKAKKMRKPLIVFAQDISQSVCSMLYYNHKKKIVQTCPIRVPFRGSNSSEYLEKIAKITDSYLFSDFSECLIENIDFKHFGKCIRITVDQFETTLVSKSTEGQRNCTILIGGNSQSEIMERYDKAVDALNSTQGAQKHGILPGGGISYMRAAQILNLHIAQQQNQTHRQALKVLAEVLEQPFKTLLRLGEVQSIKETKGWEGLNMKTKEYEDFYQSGIVDSLLVSRNCIIDSISIASMLLSLQIAIVDDTKYKQSSLDDYRGQHAL